MIAPALDKPGKDLHMTSNIEINLALSIFVLAFAIGPLVFGPASEVDVWDAEHRGKATGIYTLTPILGPVIGPIAGAFIAHDTT
ncbi:mitogen-activated protein kinase kinase kinase [Penicillium macrosclerotiorum]|uniref:mitogen-activated protein kinase kinase kinase n=1 Tax=Penicillium macrosclerotiorum TaxID=303699 RepID=UPI0025476ABB|nr:mitogen-activated protein kinase kinase kinase [Penicillium macrosclerotiorum]KAJ5682275.1 mitogen-activated protein kinase kinase kinase [Penicillium macrosclerotiorum]